MDGQLKLQDIGPAVYALGVGVLIAAVIAIVVAGFQSSSYATSTVANETVNATSDPFNHTVDKKSDVDFHQVASATCYESFSQDSTVTTDIVNDTTIELSGFTVDKGDNESCEYDWEYEGTAYDVTGNGIDGIIEISSWFEEMGLVVAAAILLTLLFGVGRYLVGNGGRV